MNAASRFIDDEKTLNQHSKAIPTKRLESVISRDSDYFLDATETDTVPSASSGSPVITSRLTAKLREIQLQLELDKESKRQSCTLHRVKWRANAKGKRSEELDRQVDKFILRDAILNNPKTLVFADQHDFDCVTGRFDESV